MYLTPSLMAGNLRVFDAFIVHPSVGYAQITTHELLLDFLFICGYRSSLSPIIGVYIPTVVV